MIFDLGMRSALVVGCGAAFLAGPTVLGLAWEVFEEIRAARKGKP